MDDSLPLVQNRGMRVQEGVRKTITEFELKAVDVDTEVRGSPELPGCEEAELLAAAVSVMHPESCARC